MQTDISIIIVSWNVWDPLRACLNSIEQCSRAPITKPTSPANRANQSTHSDIRQFGPATLGSQAPTLEVVVVDNASTDATADLLPARFPWVRFVRSATNLGFTAGNNVGYATSRGRTVYFLNPDTELVDSPSHANAASNAAALEAGAGSLWTLYRALMDNLQVAMVGPQLRYGDNSLQASRFRFPTRLTAFFGSSALGRYWRANPWQRKMEMSDWPATFCQEVDWLMGAAILVRRTALEEVRQPQFAGPFDEGFFMYSEEVDLCKRLKDAGWRMAYIPDVVVIHYQGKSSGQVLATRDIYFHSSSIRYYEKYFGQGWASALRFFLLWNLRVQLVLETLKHALGHKRSLRVSRMAAYRQVLATKLRPVPNTQ